jgi:hypothetical protein
VAFSVQFHKATAPGAGQEPACPSRFFPLLRADTGMLGDFFLIFEVRISLSLYILPCYSSYEIRIKDTNFPKTIGTVERPTGKVKSFLLLTLQKWAILGSNQ